MISLTCLSPRVFDVPPGWNPDHYYPHVLNVVAEFEEACIVLVDSGEPSVTTTAITERLRAWPTKYRKRMQELLQRLRVKQRFVKVSSYVPAVACGTFPCCHASGIAHDLSPDAFVVSEGCLDSSRGAHGAVEIVSPSQYSLSRFAASRRSMRTLCLTSGEWRTSDAERHLLGPVFRKATHVKVIDRYIGRSVPPSTAGGSAALGDDYRRSLEWIAMNFRDAAAGNARATFEVWCGINTENVLAADLVKSVAVLRSWESRMVAQGIPGFKLYVKQELPGARMVHARYLTTDQISILIERGFDMLFSDSEMRSQGLRPGLDDRPLRDATIAVIGSTGRVLADIRTLPDL